MVKVFKVVHVSKLLEVDTILPNGKPYHLQKKQITLESGADLLVAEIIGKAACNFTFKRGDVITPELRFYPEYYKTHDGEERVCNKARIIAFVNYD